VLLENRQLMAQGEDLHRELDATAAPSTQRRGERNENGRQGAEGYQPVACNLNS
jgi:hypothetical protein